MNKKSINIDKEIKYVSIYKILIFYKDNNTQSELSYSSSENFKENN